MAQEVQAKARHIPVSPQKARLVIDMVRGKDVVDALEMLTFVPNKASQPVIQVDQVRYRQRGKQHRIEPL